MTSALGQAALQAFVRASGRTWWQAGYADGRVVNEWETTKLPPTLVLVALGRGGSTSRWEELPKVGLRALRLLAPNAAARVESNRDYTLFQFKAGKVSVGVNADSQRTTEAHVIGRVTNSDGDCEIMAYEFDGPRLGTMVGPLRDNVLGLRYRSIGALALDPLGIKL